MKYSMCLTFTDTKVSFLLAHYLSVFPVGDAWRNLPLLLLLDCHLQQKGETPSDIISFEQSKQRHFDFSIKHQSTEKQEQRMFFNISANCTFLLGECITGAGGEGGPRGIFLLILKHTIVPIKFLHLSD